MAENTLKKIDVHVHTIMYPEITLPRPDGGKCASVEQLKAMYDAWGIERGMILPAVANEGNYGMTTNEEAYMICRENPDRFYWACDLTPRMGENGMGTDFSRIVNHYKSLGAKAVGELGYNLPFDDPVSEKLLCACAEADLPVDIHIADRIGDTYGVYDELHLPRIEKMLKAHPNLRIFGHSQCFWAEISGDVTEETRGLYPPGKVREGTLHRLLRTYPNLYCDLSAGSGSNAFLRDEEHGLRFIEEFEDRLLYGTDICSPKNTFAIGKWLDDRHASGDISDRAYYKICRGNAIRELKLELTY